MTYNKSIHLKCSQHIHSLLSNRNETYAYVSIGFHILENEYYVELNYCPLLILYNKSNMYVVTVVDDALTRSPVHYYISDIQRQK